MMGGTLFTSLPPKTTRIVNGRDFGLTYQRACIASWIAAGFDVISLNPENEIAELRKYDYPINYLVSPNPRPKISEFLSEASRSPSDLTGIINAHVRRLKTLISVEAHFGQTPVVFNGNPP